VWRNKLEGFICCFRKVIYKSCMPNVYMWFRCSIADVCGIHRVNTKPNFCVLEKNCILVPWYSLIRKYAKGFL